MTHYDAIPLADVLREHIRGERSAQLTIASNSMKPLLIRGDIIGLQQVDSSDIQCAQIVTFTDPDDPLSLLTHRISLIRPDDQGTPFILTRGDRMLSFDQPLKAEDVLGRVAWRIRNGRKLKIDQGAGAWLSKRLGKIAEFERFHISGVPLESLTFTPDAVSSANDQVQLHWDKPASRAARASGRAASRFLAAVVPPFAGQETIGPSGPA